MLEFIGLAFIEPERGWDGLHMSRRVPIAKVVTLGNESARSEPVASIP
jgi:hypothetical protein